MAAIESPEAIEAVREFLAELLGPSDTSIAQRIERAEAFASAAVTPPGLSIEAGVLGDVAVEWVVPDGSPPSPVFLHLHGGGYVMGDPAGSRPFTTAMALATKARVVSVAYGLAPAHPFPQAVYDALAVYKSLIREGVAPDELGVGGESAGGGLAVALLVLARSEGLPMPACALAISPWADLVCEGETYETRRGTDPLLTREILQEMAALYLAKTSPADPLASPVRANLAGLPPLLIQVGSEEVLLGDAQVLAEHAKSAGVEVRLEVWEQMIHVWHMFHPMLPQGAQAIDRAARFVTDHWKSARKGAA